MTLEQLSQYPKSHIIGELRYVLDDSRMVTALARWDVSVNTGDTPPLKPKVDVYLIGDARGIKCRFAGCNHEERWEIGQAAYMQLLSRYGKLSAL